MFRAPVARLLVVLALLAVAASCLASRVAPRIQSNVTALVAAAGASDEWSAGAVAGEHDAQHSNGLGPNTTSGRVRCPCLHEAHHLQAYHRWSAGAVAGEQHSNRLSSGPPQQALAKTSTGHGMFACSTSVASVPRARCLAVARPRCSDCARAAIIYSKCAWEHPRLEAADLIHAWFLPQKQPAFS
jgi:hypothetical protein